MRLSSKTGYGVQALYDMALHGTGRAVQAREVAERQGVPLRYLEQILQELRRVGLVDAKRGPGGGYALTRAPEAITLGEVVAALDGPVEQWLSFEPALAGERVERRRLRRRSSIAGGHGDPPRVPISTDVPGQVWGELAGRIAGVLGGVTLKDLVDRAEALGVTRDRPAPQMYFI